MKLGGLTLFSATSSKRTFTLGSWHSPHSLTWRWILSVTRQPLWSFRPYVMVNRVGVAVGLGQFLGFNFVRHNGGGNIHVAFLWHSLELHTQEPMWFKDLCRRAWDEEAERKRQLRALERELDAVRFAASRAANPSTGANLN